MQNINHSTTSRQARQARVRGRLHGTKERPRLTVFRSNEHIYLQAIDDDAQLTLAAANDASKDAPKGTKTERAIKTAEAMVALLKKAKITKLVFDRGFYKYHGRVKAVAEALREGGIQV